jgi:hypothetical protein
MGWRPCEKDKHVRAAADFHPIKGPERRRGRAAPGDARRTADGKRRAKGLFRLFRRL